MSLHARLAGLIALTVALALLVQGLFGYLDFRRSVLRHVNADLNSYLTALAHDRATGTYPNAIESESSIRARLVQGGRTLQEYGGAFPALTDQDGDTHRIVRRVSVPDLGSGAVLEASLSLHAYNLGLNAYLHTLLLSVTLSHFSVPQWFCCSAAAPCAHWTRCRELPSR